MLRSQEGDPDIWVYDPERASPTRLTRRAGTVDRPVWSHDDARIIYMVDQTHYDMFSRDWQATGPEGPLLVGDDEDFPGELSPDGRVLAFNREAAGTALDIWTMPVDGGQTEVFRATDANERDPAFAPDGRWIAYASDESGRYEIWLQSYPDTARARLPITTEGGLGPLWGPDGELFYHDGDRMMSVRVDLATGAPSIPSLIFQGSYRYLNRNYAVTADGQRLLMVKPRTEEEGREVVVVLNWFEVLKERMEN